MFLRAGEILSGHEWSSPDARNDRELGKGPARLATALGIDRRLNGVDVYAGPHSPREILTGAPAPRRRSSDAPSDGT